MIDPARPFLVLYVVWHPDSPMGREIAEALREHFRRKLYENVAGGTGLSVLFRSAPAPGSAVPLNIDLGEAQTTAVVVVADSALAEDELWTGYVRDLVDRTETAGLAARVFPVSIDPGVLEDLKLAEQALRWDQWHGSSTERRRRLISELTYELCRILRHLLEHLERPNENEAALEAYLKKVQVFLSHSKHDANGERIARSIRDHMYGGHGLASFFDVHDIPAGVRFQKVLLHQVRVSAIIAIHTDSYSSREWCRREVIEAKRCNAPLIVVNAIAELDERGFPYMGNVPIVRLEPSATDRYEFIVGRLLDEVLKDFLWRCRVRLRMRNAVEPNVFFVPRPPELISLAALPPASAEAALVIVYPDPPLSAEEERLFAAIAPHVQLRSWTEWIAGAVR